jgi:protein involved in polysaccharide export with SLBB domain
MFLKMCNYLNPFFSKNRRLVVPCLALFLFGYANAFAEVLELGGEGEAVPSAGAESRAKKSREEASSSAKEGMLSADDEALLKTKSSYRLRPRDFIRIIVIGEPDTGIERRINPDGTVDVPFLKKLVPVSGLTITEAQEALAKEFKRYFKQPQVIISISSYAERRIYISGYVGKPGPVSVPPEETLTLGRAISMAGGILPRGRRSDISIKRMVDGKMTVIVKDLRKIDSGDQPDFVLEDEDSIYVEDSRF